MGCFSILVLKTLFALTASQVSITVVKHTVNVGDSVVLTCTVPDFTDNIFVIQNISTTRSVCVANSPCTSTDASLYTVAKSGTDTVIFTILSFSKTRDEGSWFVRYGSNTDSTPIILSAETSSPTSQMSTYLDTERTTSVNSIFELSNRTIPTITGSITPTSDISASNTSFLNTGPTNIYEHTESTNFYSNFETTHFYTKTSTITSYANTETTNLNGNFETTTFYANTETTNVDVNTETNEIQTKTLTVSLLLSIPGNSSWIQQIISSAESPLMSTTIIDQISYSPKVEDSSFSSHQYLSETSVTLPKISVSNQLPSSIIDTMNHFIYTTNTLITSYLDDTRHSFDDFTDVFQTFSPNYAASVSTSFANFSQSTNHHLSLQTTEYNVAMQTEFTSYVTTTLYESHTDNAATGIYSKEIVTSGQSYMHNGVTPSQTQLASMNDIQDSTTDFQSTYFEPNSQSNDEGFSSEISENLLSTLQSTSLLLPFNTQASASESDSYMETTNMLTFESQSGIPTKDLSFFTNPSSIQISTVLIDFKPTLLTTTINFNSKTMPSMIKPSSKQTNSGISYIEIETSFKDSLFSLDSFSGSVISNDQDMTSLSSVVDKSIKTLSTKTIQSGLSEKNKTIIFITTTSAVIAMIVVILLIIFAKVYMSKNIMKPRKEDDNISWSNKRIPPKAAFPDYSFNGKSIYPLLNTSSVSFKMFPYEHHWNDIV